MSLANLHLCCTLCRHRASSCALVGRRHRVLRHGDDREERGPRGRRRDQCVGAQNDGAEPPEDEPGRARGRARGRRPHADGAAGAARDPELPLLPAAAGPGAGRAARRRAAGWADPGRRRQAGSAVEEGALRVVRVREELHPLHLPRRQRGEVHLRPHGGAEAARALPQRAAARGQLLPLHPQLLHHRRGEQAAQRHQPAPHRLLLREGGLHHEGPGGAAEGRQGVLPIPRSGKH